MQLVYEFGAKELEPVVGTIQKVIGDVQYSVKSMPNDSDTYSPTSGSLLSMALELRDGRLASFSLHPNTGLIRYALISCPSFAGQDLSTYLGTIEYLGDDYRPLWDLILCSPRLSFACLGFEEGVELTDSLLSVESFPWHQWPLVIGAIRERSGSPLWRIKSGPEMKWFSNEILNI